MWYCFMNRFSSGNMITTNLESPKEIRKNINIMNGVNLLRFIISSYKSDFKSFIFILLLIWR